jgi:peptide/nickel transport system substrate-binding protein
MKMKKKILWFGLSFLVVAGFALASGDEEVSEEQADTMGPQYGGTLTFYNGLIGGLFADFEISFDHVAAPAFWVSNFWTGPYAERLLTGDVEKYGFGPGGTGEFDFNAARSVPEEFLGGELAESWEITADPLGVTFTIRQGVMWTGNPNIGMEPREFTAHDAETSLNYLIGNPSYEAWFPWIDSLTAIDKYTLRLEMKEYSASWAWGVGFGILTGMLAPETIASSDSHRWENAAGTGPFIVSDFVEGSHVKYVRNPNYWGTDTIDGVEYQLPFVDELVFPIIADESTRVANLRTAQIDWWFDVPLTFSESLARTSPGLTQDKYVAQSVEILRINSHPGRLLGNKAVRRALMTGTDLQAVSDALYGAGEAVVHAYPLLGNPAHVPMEDLPASVAELFDYDPSKARQMFADAGYAADADGISFKTSLTIGTRPEERTIGALLADMWADIGVELELIALDDAAASAAWGTMDYETALWPTSTGEIMVVDPDTYQASWRWWYEDEWWNEQIALAKLNPDPTARTAILEAVGLHLLDEVYSIGFGSPFLVSGWWPWLNNYYGGKDTGHNNHNPFLRTIWIDQKLKADMGY